MHTVNDSRDSLTSGPIYRIVFSLFFLFFSMRLYSQVADNGNVYVQDILNCRNYSTFCYEQANITFPTRITFTGNNVNRITVNKERFVDLSCQDSFNLGYLLRTYTINKLGGKKVTCKDHKTFIKRATHESIHWPTDTVKLYYAIDSFPLYGFPDLFGTYGYKDTNGFLHPKIIIKNNQSIGLTHPPLIKYNKNSYPLSNQYLCSITAEYSDSIIFDHFLNYSIHRTWTVHGCNLYPLVYNQVINIIDTIPVQTKNNYIYATSSLRSKYTLNKSDNPYQHPWINPSNLAHSHIIITKDSLNGTILDSLPWDNSSTTVLLNSGEFFIKYYVRINKNHFLYKIENVVADNIPDNLLKILNSQVDSYDLIKLSLDTLSINYFSVKFFPIAGSSNTTDILSGDILIKHNSNFIYTIKGIKMYGLDKLISSALKAMPKHIQINCDVDEFPKDQLKDLLDNNLTYVSYIKNNSRRVPLPLINSKNLNPLAPGPFPSGIIDEQYHDLLFTDYLHNYYVVNDSLVIHCGLGYTIIRNWNIKNSLNGKSWFAKQVIDIKSNPTSIPQLITLNDTTISFVPYKIDFEKYISGCFEKFQIAKNIKITGINKAIYRYYPSWNNNYFEITLDTGQYILEGEIISECNSTISIVQTINFVSNKCTPYRNLRKTILLFCNSDRFPIDSLIDIFDPNLFDTDSNGILMPKPLNLKGELNNFTPFYFNDEENITGTFINRNTIQFNNKCHSTVSYSDRIISCIGSLNVTRNWLINNIDETLPFEQNFILVNSTYHIKPYLFIPDTVINTSFYPINIFEKINLCINHKPRLNIDTILVNNIPHNNFTYDDESGQCNLTLPKGDHQLTIIIKDHCYFRLTIEQKVNVDIKSPINFKVNSRLLPLNTKLYPNPSTDRFNLEITSEKPDWGEVLIYNAHHQLIYMDKIKIDPGHNIITIPDLKSKGIHFYQLKLSQEVSTGKFIRM